MIFWLNKDSGMNLFVYGTLVFPELYTAITNRQRKKYKAILKGYKRVSLENLPFPALVKASEHTQPGFLIKNIEPEELLLLIDYEGDMYEYEQLEVQLDHSVCDAIVFLLKPEFEGLISGEEWDMDGFSKLHLDSYLRECRRFREEL